MEALQPTTAYTKLVLALVPKRIVGAYRTIDNQSSLATSMPTPLPSLLPMRRLQASSQCTAIPILQFACCQVMRTGAAPFRGSAMWS